MNGKARPPSAIKKFWFVDFLVITFFLFTAALSLYLFRQDLMQTIEARDEEPVGIIIIRNNVVQRRYADRVLWERLFVDSPVYSGDLIRAADLSAATIHIDYNQISLNENTLIRIQHESGSRIPLQIELKEGNLSLASGAEGSGIVLSLMGRQVQTEPGTALNAEMGEEGIIVQVSEGTATFIEEGESRELTEGMMIAQDPSGMERIIPAAVVTSFGPNARYLKNQPEPLPIDFGWNSVNIEDGENVRLEIAGDRGFTKDFRTIEGLDNHALVNFDSGLWFWRISYGDSVLSRGQITVAEASGPELLSPVTDSVFRYYNDLPQVRFQWSAKSGASQYVLEVGETPDFENMRISRQTAATTFIQSELGQGTWYWRVRPVFPSSYEGSAVYSSTASFRIEQSEDPQLPALEVPEPVPVPTNTPTPGRNYTVQSGDTLGDIAWQAYGQGGRWSVIAEANELPDPNIIDVDQVLFIPVVE